MRNSYEDAVHTESHRNSSSYGYIDVTSTGLQCMQTFNNGYCGMKFGIRRKWLQNYSNRWQPLQKMWKGPFRILTTVIWRTLLLIVCIITVEFVLMYIVRSLLIGVVLKTPLMLIQIFVFLTILTMYWGKERNFFWGWGWIFVFLP